MSSCGSPRGKWPSSIPRARDAAQAASSSRLRARTLLRAASSRGADRRASRRSCCERRTRYSCMSFGARSKPDSSSSTSAVRQSVLAATMWSKRSRVLDDCSRHDLVEAVLLRLEVVVERRGADPDRCGDVRPLRLVVAVAPEVVGGDVEDLVPLRARTRPRRPRGLACDGPWRVWHSALQSIYHAAQTLRSGPAARRSSGSSSRRRSRSPGPCSTTMRRRRGRGECRRARDPSPGRPIGHWRRNQRSDRSSSSSSEFISVGNQPGAIALTRTPCGCPLAGELAGEAVEARSSTRRTGRRERAPRRRGRTSS